MAKNTDDFDKDLNPILEIAPNEDLQYLVDIITSTYNNVLDSTDTYKMHKPNHREYADLLAREIRQYGGNTFANIFRGFSGPSYKEIVCDVASKLNAPYKKSQDVSMIEDSILSAILDKALSKMSDAEKQEILKEMGNKKDAILTGPALSTAILTAFKMGGFFSYQITQIVVQALLKAILGHGVRVAVVSRTASIIMGPIGWAVTGIWTAIDLAGPAFRVTVPCIAYIAMLRKKFNSAFCPKCNHMCNTNTRFCPECGTTL